MIDVKELLRKGEEYHQGYMKGQIDGLDKHNKIFIELWDKMNDIENLIKELTKKVSEVGK